MSLEVENVNVLFILDLKEMMWDVLVAIGEKQSKQFHHVTMVTERDRPRAVVAC